MFLLLFSLVCRGNFVSTIGGESRRDFRNFFSLISLASPIVRNFFRPNLPDFAPGLRFFSSYQIRMSETGAEN